MSKEAIRLVETGEVALLPKSEQAAVKQRAACTRWRLKNKNKRAAAMRAWREIPENLEKSREWVRRGQRLRRTGESPRRADLRELIRALEQSNNKDLCEELASLIDARDQYACEVIDEFCERWS